ncbi:MAG TPA: hypothetical protein VIJ94_17370 [Caulobacteraceae bacterium]
MIDSGHLFDVARHLATPPARGKPRQADLRRAVSTAYYALFHYVLTQAAGELVGSTPATKRTKVWALVYRGFNHREMATRCGQVSNPPLPLEAQDFGLGIRALAAEFKILQNERHNADYDPHSTFTLQSVQGRIHAAEAAIRRFDASPRAERKLFLTFLLMGARARA